MRPTPKHVILVTIQLALATAIALSGPLIPSRPVPVLLLALGTATALSAIWVMRIGRFNITPDPHPHAEAVVRGPYRIVRHPMYVGLILVTLAWIFQAPATPRGALWILLLIVLDQKARLEERLLQERFPHYADYSRTVARFLPWIY